MIRANLILSVVMMLPALTTGAQQTPASWHVAPPVTVQSVHVAFVSHGTTLNGTLYYPSNRLHAPAVVVLHGASSPSQNLPLYAHLRQMLPPLGIAVFLFDRRAGKDRFDFHALAQDGIAARNALAADPHVNAAKIGYWGISQGGWLALLAASTDPKAAFVISVSAPMTTPDVQMNFAVENILRIHGYGRNEIDIALAARRSVDAYLRGTLDRASAQRALDAARAQPWFPLIYLNDTVGDPNSSSWLQQMRFDPMLTLQKVSAPVLMLFGQDDPWVPVRLSIERLQPIIRQHPSIDVRVVPGADHTMMLGIAPKDQIDPQFFPREAPNAPAYFALLTAWLVQHGFAR